MHHTTSTAVRNRIAITLGCLAAALVTASLGAAGNEQTSRPVGTWAVQVTLRNCTTNAPMGAVVNSLVTFHRGGTLTEDAGSLTFAPGQRSGGHGAWSHLPGGTFSQRMIALILFDTPANLPGAPGFDPAAPISPGFFAGWQTVTHTLRLTDETHAVSAGTNTFYKADGSVYRTGCSTAVAERFQ
jgi:hypothetical protein